MAATWQLAVLYGVFAVGVAVSLFAFFWGNRLRRGTHPKLDAFRADPAFLPVFSNEFPVAGELEVECADASKLMDALLLALQNPFHGTQGAWARSPTERGDLQAQRTAPGEIAFSAWNMLVGKGLVRAEAGSAPGRQRVRYVFGAQGVSGKVWAGQLWALLLGLSASTAGPALVWFFLLSSANPAVRAQFLQILQTLQVLWEPYLFIGIASKRMKMAERYFESMVLGAAYEVRTGLPAPPLPAMPTARGS